MKALAIWLALAGAAGAQDLPFDTAGLEACVTNAETMLDAEACVGAAAQACIEAPGGYTTAGMSMCYGKEADYWDGRLNAAYKSLMERSKSDDAAMADSGLTVPRTAPALREMQRAWIVYRDASCSYERSTWGGGTGGGPASAGCVMELTAEQALRLEIRLDDMENR